jgi:hypothetical protein
MSVQCQTDSRRHAFDCQSRCGRFLLQFRGFWSPIFDLCDDEINFSRFHKAASVHLKSILFNVSIFSRMEERIDDRSAPLIPLQFAVCYRLAVYGIDSVGCDAMISISVDGFVADLDSISSNSLRTELTLRDFFDVFRRQNHL